ncbi:hypothetical protein PIB30_049925 [Stylosanthes scabra]|uniref:Uncharacterized protein n=1 Tax=Stylosanthes scabra TaxID=79078 RepID=A0ABU6QJ24_9FABA|nr:hypothetical protein [Stylosanthes scabra]
MLMGSFHTLTSQGMDHSLSYFTTLKQLAGMLGVDAYRTSSRISRVSSRGTTSGADELA